MAEASREVTRESGSSSSHLHDRLASIIDKIGFTRSHRLIILMVLIGVFIDVIEQQSVGLVAPSLMEVWGISLVQVGWLSSATFGAMTIGILLNGVLGDFKGRKFSLALNLTLYVVGAIVCALAPNYEILLIARIIVGVGLGGELSAAITYISEITATRHRAAAVSSINVGAAGLGNIAAPGLAALVLVVFGAQLGGVETSWRWFFALLALPAFLLIFYRWFLPETPRFLLSQGKGVEANRSLSVLATGRLRLKDDEITPYFAAEDFVALDVTKPQLGEVFRSRLRTRTVAVAIAHFFAFGAQVSIMTLLPSLLVEQGFNIASSLVFTMLMQIGSLLGALGAGVFGGRVNRRTILALGSVMAGLSGLGFAFLSVNVPLLLIFGFLFNFFALLINTSIWAWAPELYPTRIRAFGTSIIIGIGSLGPVALPPLAGFLLGTGGVVPLFIMTTAAYTIVLFLVRFAPETRGVRLEDVT